MNIPFDFSNKYKKIIITGGYGFIGSCLIRNLINKTNCEILNIDKLNYASNKESVNIVLNSENKKRYHFSKTDLNDKSKLELLINNFKPDLIFHLAAETHVDKSILDPEIFVKNNINATFYLIETAYKYWSSLNSESKKNFLFMHVSTDEVFGSLNNEGLFSENTPYNPSSPYSASKASSDHLVSSWNYTYNFPTIITNCSNNYGPWQFIDKLIPVIINNAMNNKEIPIYGDGKNIRDWLFVEDHIYALIAAAYYGKSGDKYCIGGNNEKSNIAVAEEICKILDNIFPENKPHKKLLNFVKDRLGHDFRYAINNQLIKNNTGWAPKYKFEEGLKKTVHWYIDNK